MTFEDYLNAYIRQSKKDRKDMTKERIGAVEMFATYDETGKPASFYFSKDAAIRANSETTLIKPVYVIPKDAVLAHHGIIECDEIVQTHYHVERAKDLAKNLAYAHKGSTCTVEPVGVFRMQKER